MRTSLPLFLLFLLPFCAHAQDSDQILAEGKTLFYLEKASWYGTDYYLANFPDQRDKIGGYLSYVQDNKVVNIFYSRFDRQEILARMYFAANPDQTPIEVDTLNHTATPHEVELITLRHDALDRVSTNEDGFFSYYENTSFNTIPLITGKTKKVYIITAPRNSGVVLLGNDYLLEYNGKLKLKSKTKIHNSLIELPIMNDGDNKAISAMHSHVNSKYIDATDICTLLLYKDYVSWEQHIVISKKQVSLFNLKTETLTVISRKVWDSIGANE